MEARARRMELEQVEVQTPCPKRWQELEGDERKRFCSECALHVVNLSALTRDEGQALLDEQGAGARLCVSYSRRTDGTLVTTERVSRWRRVANLAASLLFGLFPLLAACRPTATQADVVDGGPDPAASGTDDGPCIELTGEVALPEPETTHHLSVPESRLGRIAVPAQEHDLDSD